MSETFLEFMQYKLNEGACFRSSTFKFIVLKKSIPIESVIDSPKNYVEPLTDSDKIDDNELKVFVDFLDTMRKESYTRVKAYEENEVYPLM